MIHSIKFKKRDSSKEEMGYLYQKEYDTVLRKGKTIEDYERERTQPSDIRRHSLGRFTLQDKYFKQVYKGYKNKKANKVLVGKQICFKPNINVLFGPNGCGKSTILKSLAHACLCGREHNIDGWTNATKFEPIQFWSLKDENYNIRSKVESQAGNPFQMNWDGTPVYYLDIKHLLTNNSIDGFQSGTINNTRDGLLFTMERSSLSSGQLMYSMLDRLYTNIIKPKTIKSVLDEFEELRNIPKNDKWSNLYQSMEEYYNGFINDDNPMERFTLIIDEPDRNLDLESSYELWYEIMPSLSNHFNCQIIVATHNPFVISEGVLKNPIYNVISLDKKFTKGIKTKLSNIRF